MIRAILACDDAWGIGKDNNLPWPKNPADLTWFKENTLNGAIVMGRNTWQSLPFKPLPERYNVVVSSTMRERSGVEIVRPDIYRSRVAILSTQGNVWIIGGAKLINSSLDMIDEIWLSRISGTYDCDTFMPRSLIEELFTLTVSEKQNDVYVEVWEKK